jgi:hypothetical protein
MVASANRENVVDWTKCVGSIMHNIVFQAIMPDEAKLLHSHIVQLYGLVPAPSTTREHAEAVAIAVVNANQAI